MASHRTATLVALIIFLLAQQGFVRETAAAGECGKTPVNAAAVSLSPCAGAAKSPRAKVPPVCCTKIAALIRSSPKCLCAVFLSPLAEKAGINPAVAITVPKRCNIKKRPVGKKCGRKIRLPCYHNGISQEAHNWASYIISPVEGPIAIKKDQIGLTRVMSNIKSSRKQIWARTGRGTI